MGQYGTDMLPRKSLGDVGLSPSSGLMQPEHAPKRPDTWKHALADTDVVLRLARAMLWMSVKEYAE